MRSADDSLDGVLRFLLTQAPRPVTHCASIDEWWPLFRAARGDWALPIDQALAGGVLADRIGYAFAAGYQAALRAMDPELPLDRMACFSVTEEGGGHPRAVQTALSPAGAGYLLNGKKKWATLSSDGGVALVVASTGHDEQGRNRLRVLRVPLSSPGVTVVAMPPTHFSPEVPHRRLEFADVAVSSDQLLPGDGYERYVKPFRTLEDTHVSAAILAYLLALASRASWPAESRAEIVQLIVSVRALALAPADSPAVHVGLEGVFQARHQLLQRCSAYWDHVELEERQRWQRDAALSNIAGNVRAQRAERAWSMFPSPAAA